MGREAKAKIEGAKFLKRDRAQEEDEKFMATVAKGRTMWTSTYCMIPSKILK